MYSSHVFTLEARITYYSQGRQSRATCTTLSLSRCLMTCQNTLQRLQYVTCGQPGLNNIAWLCKKTTSTTKVISEMEQNRIANYVH